jgi:hypothetical protein
MADKKIEENQDIIQVANTLLIRMIVAANDKQEDHYLINVENGVVYVSETEYLDIVEKGSVAATDYIKSIEPEISEKDLHIKLDEYAQSMVLKYMDWKLAVQVMDDMKASKEAEAAKVNKEVEEKSTDS